MAIDNFVDRRRELTRLNSELGEVIRGNGRVLLIEGGVGIGKTALINKFLTQISNFTVLKSWAEPETQYMPYILFNRAMEKYGFLRGIREQQERRKIESLAIELLKSPATVFLDDGEGVAGLFLYSLLKKKISGIAFTIDPLGEHWLTRVRSEKDDVNPSRLEFSVIPKIYDFIRETKKAVVYVENVNYLLYLNGIERVIDFLSSLSSISKGKHIIILSGKVDILTEEERNAISPYIDRYVSVEGYKRSGERVIMSRKINHNGVVFSTSPERSEYTVSRGHLNPERADFELFDVIVEEMKKGNDVVLDCLESIFHYNGIASTYCWVKDLRDYAHMYGVRLILIDRRLTPQQKTVLFGLVDKSDENIGTYETAQDAHSLKFYDAVLSFLINEARRKPLILILEDLQWADRSSMALIEYLSRNIRKSRIMIIVTYRNEDIALVPWLLKEIENIRNVEHSHIIRLQPLSEKAIREMFPRYDYTTQSIICRKSSGNPLLAQAVAESIERGEEFLPESIRDSIYMHLESLDDGTLYFLRFLSVIGDYIDEFTLEDLFPNYKKYLLKLEDMFLKVTGKRIGFIHSIYRDIIYQGIAPDTRVKMHLIIGKYLESKSHNVSAAYHFYRAGDVRAIALFMDAAEEARRMAAIHNAIEYYENALEVAIKYDMHNEICDIYEKIGDFYTMVGNYREAIRAYTNGKHKCESRRVALTTKIGECHGYLGEYREALNIFITNLKNANGLERGIILGQIGVIKWRTGEFDEALKNLEEYMRIAEQSESMEDVGEACRQIAIVYYHKADFEKSLRFAKEALKITLKTGDYSKIASAYNIIGVAYQRQYRLDEAQEYFRRYLEIAEKIGNFDYISMAYNNMAVSYEMMGNMAKARDYYMLSIEYELKVGNTRDISISYNNLAMVEAEMGNYEKALEYLGEGAKYAEKMNDRYNLCKNFRNLGSTYLDIGEYTRAEEYTRRALEIAEREKYEEEIVVTNILYSLVLLRQNLVENAREHLNTAKLVLTKIDAIILKFMYEEAEVEYNIKIGNIDLAEEIVEELISLSDIIGEEYEKMSALRHLARLRCIRGDVDTALRYYEELIDYFKKMERRRIYAEILYEIGKCLLTRDVKKAVKKMRLSADIFHSMNLTRKAEEVEQEIENIYSNLGT